ncbi:MAG: thiamine pyrophosphate-dependent enzyme, partial [Pseudomonadota bacterium]|nr:thiamine pyrophosphate-dependent enzyme [Pseudomonadota bacterium]
RKRTIMIEGDGGFAMNLQELETVQRLNLPIKIFILNNSGYASIRNTQNNYFAGRLYGSCPEGGLTLPNWEGVAKAFGLPYKRLAHNSEQDNKLDDILNQDGPVFCEVIVSPTLMTAPRVTSRKTADGRMESAPMEDMAPLLDRREIAENMESC